MEKRRKIVIDCDPGQDDAVALALAAASREKLEILGITTVAGNVKLKSTQRNARLICEMVGMSDVPVYAGCDRPIIRELFTAEEYHGENGLNGIELYEPETPLQRQHAVEFLTETLQKAKDDSITLVCIAPLTNIALVLIQNPQLVKKIQEIVIMGGSVKEAGNSTAAAEFNFYVDPHAADIVLKCGRPIAIFGLDATHQARMTEEQRNRMNELPSNPSIEILKISVDYFSKAYKEIYDQDSAPIHDVLTVAYLLKPTLFEGIKRNVRVETESELTMGVSVVDYWNLENHTQNATWITDVKSDELFDLIFEKLSRV